VLTQEGNRFRRLEAQALYTEGLTTAQVASVLGVSRQRVSAMLREDG
jgi:predicted transcriptional regulator